MNIDQTTNTKKLIFFPDTPFPPPKLTHKWPWITMPTYTIYPPMAFSESETLIGKKSETLHIKKNYTTALSILNDFQGKSMYVTALKIETLHNLELKNKIIEEYLTIHMRFMIPERFLLLPKPFIFWSNTIKRLNAWLR